jgi:hypothetical protein
MEVDWTFTEEGFLCCRGMSFQLEPPRKTWKRRAEKKLEENDKEEILKYSERRGER